MEWREIREPAVRPDEPAGTRDQLRLQLEVPVWHGVRIDHEKARIPVRVEVARALGQVKNSQFRPLLVPLMYDADLTVAREAIQSAGRLGASDFLFVPPLVSQANALWAKLPDEFDKLRALLIRYKVLRRRVTLAREAFRRGSITVDELGAASARLAARTGDSLRAGKEAFARRDWPTAVELLVELGFVLLDLGMPRLDGYEVARRIRAEEWGRQLVLVALTGWGQDEDRRRTSEAGFDWHLVKPFAEGEIVAVLRAAVRTA